MGGLISTRKRGNDHCNVNFKSPLSTSLSSFDNQFGSHVTKKRKPSSLMHPNCAASRIYGYPEPKKQIPREVHAPGRGHKLRFWASFSNSNKVRENEGSADKLGNELSLNYEQAQKKFNESLRYCQKDKGVVVDLDEESDEGEDSVAEVIDLVEETDGDGVSENLSTDEIELVENGHGEEESISVSANADSELETAGKFFKSLSLDSDVPELPVHRKLLESAEKRNDKLGRLSLEIDLNEERLAAFRLDHLGKKAKEKDIFEDLLLEAFTPLTEKEEADVSQAFSEFNLLKVVVIHESSNIVITGEVLRCLRPGEWLNDEVINLYLELLKEREKRKPKRFLRCHFFNTFFYKKLIGGKSGYHYKSVKRWTSQKKLGYNLYDCDKVFVPIHKEEQHWCLAVINKKDEKFQYLDSLGGVDSEVLKVLAMYFVHEVKDKSGVDIDVDSWTQEQVKDLPGQTNGWDCGMFMIKYADFYSRGLGLCFNQEHMPYFRLRTAKEILRLQAN